MQRVFMGRCKAMGYTALGVMCLVSFNIAAQQDITLEDDLRPVWEAGLFAAAFDTPEYPAAGQNHTNVIVAPYFVYRGETFRVGDGAIARAVAIDKANYELDVSLAASFGASSDDNRTRAGMPDVDFIFELGPQLKVRLSQFDFVEHGNGELFLNLQARAAFSTDFSGIEHQGYVFQPILAYRQRGWLSEKTALSLSISPTWATEALHDYFYQVDADFATAQRPAYDAKGGYIGTNLAVGFSFDATKDIRVFLGASTALHSSAANQDSPLFIDKSTYSIGAGLVWRLYESDQRVAGR